MNEAAKNLEELKKITDYLAYRIGRRLPFLEEVYKQVRLETELPQFFLDEGYGEDYYYCTDGAVLYVNLKVKDSYENKNLEVELELIHELLHIYMGHPVFAQERTATEYNAACDVEVNRWIKQLYPSENTGKYPIQKEKMTDEIWKHFLWYPDAWGYSEHHLLKITLPAWEHGTGNDQTEDDKETNEPGNIGGKDEIRSTGKYLQDISKESAVSYIDVMKKYIYIQEKSCKTDEELDRILYSYGFDLYGDITFVEYPETIEKRIISFYMAIDTSGSCDRKKVSKFLGHTKSVIRELSDNGKNEIDIHMFMADCKIDQELHICMMEDFPKVSELRIAKGGTDFRPVMERVAELEQTRKIKKDGRTALFYYTDGLGEFPAQRPDFDTWFLMDGEDIRNLQDEIDEFDTENFIIPEWVRVIEI